MMQMHVKTDDLLKWSQFMEQMPHRVTKPAVAKALNNLGDQILQKAVEFISEKTQQDTSAIRERILVQRATRGDLTWMMDASLAVPSEGRDFQGRDESQIFDQDTLVNVVTMEDGYDCDVCQQIAEANPYTMQQINEMQAKWANYVPPTQGILHAVRTNLVHPNCRCLIEPWQSYRRMPVSIGEPRGGEMAQPRLFTMQQLARAVADEIKASIRAHEVTA